MKKPKALPKTIYVEQHRDGKESYLVASYDASEMADRLPVRVGVYELTGMVTVKQVIEITK